MWNDNDSHKRICEICVFELKTIKNHSMHMILNYCIRNGFLLYGKHMSNESWCHFNSISFWILFFLFAYRGRASPCFRLVVCIFDKMNLNHLRNFSNLITTTACHGKEVGNIHNTQKYSRHEFITTPDEFYVQKTEKKKRNQRRVLLLSAMPFA